MRYDENTILYTLYLSYIHYIIDTYKITETCEKFNNFSARD